MTVPAGASTVARRQHVSVARAVQRHASIGRGRRRLGRGDKRFTLFAPAHEIGRESSCGRTAGSELAGRSSPMGSCEVVVKGAETYRGGKPGSSALGHATSTRAAQRRRRVLLLILVRPAWRQYRAPFVSSTCLRRRGISEGRSNSARLETATCSLHRPRRLAARRSASARSRPPRGDRPTRSPRSARLMPSSAV